MRKLLAVMLIGGTLIMSTSAAFAQDNPNIDDPSGFLVPDQQSVPFTWWWSWLFFNSEVP